MPCFRFLLEFSSLTVTVNSEVGVTSLLVGVVSDEGGVTTLVVGVTSIGGGDFYDGNN